MKRRRESVCVRARGEKQETKTGTCRVTRSGRIKSIWNALFLLFFCFSYSFKDILSFFEIDMDQVFFSPTSHCVISFGENHSRSPNRYIDSCNLICQDNIIFHSMNFNILEFDCFSVSLFSQQKKREKNDKCQCKMFPFLFKL